MNRTVGSASLPHPTAAVLVLDKEKAPVSAWLTLRVASGQTPSAAYGASSVQHAGASRLYGHACSACSYRHWCNLQFVLEPQRL
jgi:hypothetical protein